MWQFNVFFLLQSVRNFVGMALLFALLTLLLSVICTSCMFVEAQETAARKLGPQEREAQEAEAQKLGAQKLGPQSLGRQAASSKRPFVTSKGQKIFYQQVYSFQDVPWGFDFLAPDKLIVTLKGGQAYILEKGQLKARQGQLKARRSTKNTKQVQEKKQPQAQQSQDDVELNKLSPNWQAFAIQGLPKSQVMGQGGLMDVRLHPDFKNNRWVYFSYNVTVTGQGSSGQGTHIARAKLSVSAPYQLTQLKVLFAPSQPGQGGRHFGSRLEWGVGDVCAISGQVKATGAKVNTQGQHTSSPRPCLFFGVGDRGERKAAQNLKDARGKIFRIFDDGQVPPDNPFAKRYNKNTMQKKSKPQKSRHQQLPPVYKMVWSYGHRNPQGLFRHPHTGQLWSNEHGPRGGDEINLIKKGLNYGWPVITYGREYWGPRIGTTHKKGMQQPVKYFVPSIAPSSLMIYSGKKFKKWRGHFFSTSLVLTHINRLVIKNNKGIAHKVIEEERLFKSLGQRWRHIRENSRGEIFASSDSGAIYKID